LPNELVEIERRLSLAKYRREIRNERRFDLLPTSSFEIEWDREGGDWRAREFGELWSTSATPFARRPVYMKTRAHRMRTPGATEELP
jgi:hypothetical protein